MNALVVGADRLGNIPDVLADFGIRIMDHVSGRQAAHQRRSSGAAAALGATRSWSFSSRTFWATT